MRKDLCGDTTKRTPALAALWSPAEPESAVPRLSVPAHAREQVGAEGRQPQEAGVGGPDPAGLLRPAAIRLRTAPQQVPS